MTNESLCECRECGDTEPNPDCDLCWVESWRRVVPQIEVEQLEYGGMRFVR